MSDRFGRSDRTMPIEKWGQKWLREHPGEGPIDPAEIGADLLRDLGLPVATSAREPDESKGDE